MKNIHVSILGSTSFGNSSIVYNNDNDIIMIDCGFSATYITTKLEELNFSIQNIKALFITHIHEDHVKSSFLRKLIANNIPIYLHKTFELHLFRKFKYLNSAKLMGLVKVFDTRSVELNNYVVTWFSVPHDSKGGCYGYNIDDKKTEKRVTISTDLGFPKDNLIEHFIDSDIIVIESNHDLIMLENSDRSENLKDRIKKIGHLSNVQTSNFISSVLKSSKKLPKAIILAHISQECNTNQIAVSNMVHQLQKDGYHSGNPQEGDYNIEVIETFRDKISNKVSI